MQGNNVIKILHLEDNPIDSQLVQSALCKANLAYEYLFADNEADYLSFLANQNVDIILSDYHLPDYSGNEALQHAKTNYPHIPFVFVSGTMGEDVAIESLLNGATDYVLKNKLGRLGSAVQRAYKESLVLKARQQAELALLQSEENFHRSISESPLGIRIVSVNGRTIYANQSFLDIYEFQSLDEFKDTPAKLRYTPESYQQHLERKEIRKLGGEAFDYEISIFRKNNEIRHVKVSRKEVLWNGVKHFQVINQDITDQKKLTSDLIKAKEKAEESDRLKTAFLHNISHEIRTPMNAIVGFSGFLNDPNLTADRRAHFIDVVEQSCNQLLSIISDIVSIATIEAGQEKIRETEIHLNALLKLMYEQYIVKANERNLSLNILLSLPDSDDGIISDETKLTQTLTNLIGNAFKFTKHGSISFGYTLKDSEIEFFVQDTGIGIDAEMYDEIFKRFRQVESSVARKFGGSGLGLSISKAYIEMLGGKIWLNSVADQGSSFYFTIPYKKPEAKPEIKFQPEKDVHFDLSDTKTLLIAEDEDSNYMLLQEILSVLNLKIIRVSNGVDAVACCKSEPIDLVLMDIKMPFMDGYEATRRIREFLPHLPIIAQTAYSTQADKMKALSCGCNDFLSKPFKRDLFISKIKQQLEKK